MANLKSELQTRSIKKKVLNDKYEIVGIEIKNRRKLNSRTLESLSSNVCSQSYLCKIEKNKIDPNKAFLREICSRLELSDEKVDYLFELKDVLLKVAYAYVIGDTNYIEYAYEHGKGFNNYRFSIIKFIYHLSIYELDEASNIYTELLPIISNMSDFDLSVFSIFSAILSFYKYDYKNALDDLEYVEDITNITELKILKKMVEFKTHFAINSYDTPMYYESLKHDLFENEYLDLIEELNYTIGLYYIKNNCDKSYEMILEKMKNKKYITSLNAIKAFFDNNYAKLMSYEDNYLNDFALSLKLICAKNKYVKEIYEKNNKGYYKTDYDSFLIEYYLIKTFKERYDYIFDKGLPMACKSSDNFLCKFFFNELTKMPKISRTRAILKAHAMINGLPYKDMEIDVYED